MAGSAVDRRERILVLISELLHTEVPLTAEELWHRVPGYDPSAPLATVRQAFERDKRLLRECGVPLVTAPVPDSDPRVDGYIIDRKRYYFELPELDGDELSALRLAASLVNVSDVDPVEALWRVGGSVDQGDEHLGPLGALASHAGTIADLPAVDGLDVLFEAIPERRRVEFTYNGEARSVDPWRLDFRRGRWLLTGHDHLRGERRVFRVDRIEEPVDGPLVAAGPSQSFDRPDHPEPPPEMWGFAIAEATEVEVHVDDGHVAQFLHELGAPADTVDRPDGSALVRFIVRNPEGLRWLVLGMLDHAEVVSPPELRAEIVEWLEAFA